MCCPFSGPKARIENIQVLQNDESKIHFVGYVNFSPQNVTSALLRFFQRLELAEAYAEICDGTFDLFGKLFQTYINQNFFDALHQLHESAHTIEEVLHAVCFFSDITRLISGRFIEYHDKKKTQIDYIRTIARVLLAGSHFSATLSFGVKLHFGLTGYLATTQIALSLGGYALLSISTIWRRFYNEKQHHFASDFCIYSTGMVYEVISVLKDIELLKPCVFMLKKVRTISHVIHGYSKKDRLMPPDRIKIKGNIDKMIRSVETSSVA